MPAAVALDWVRRQMTRPTPRCLRWLDALEDACPVWALPWLLAALIGGVAVLVVVPATRRQR